MHKRVFLLRCVNYCNTLFRISALLVISLSISACNKVSHDSVYVVKDVIDGDTIVLSNNKRVRYLGIDTPEVRVKVAGEWIYSPEPFAIEATNLNKRLVQGKSVKLTFDNERTDRYGRWLAYVYVGDLFVNYELIRSGNAELFRKGTNLKHYEILKKAQEEARREKIGIWSQQ